jgi:transcriptional regulatory protein LevR
MMTLNKKPKATKCSNHQTISLIVHTAKIVERILRRRVGRKTEDAIGMLRTISELLT